MKLLPTPEQSISLNRTLAACNAACEYISGVAWESQTFRQFDIHKQCYRQVRERFGLSAQTAVRAISKVADAYKLDRNTRRAFRPTGSAAYDQRILSYAVEASPISIWSLTFVCGQHQRTLLAKRKGETDLALVRGKWYALANCSVPHPKAAQPNGFLGVAVGVAQIAADSDGTLYSGREIKSIRPRQRRLRAKLQARRTRSAKRRLKKLSGKERRLLNMSTTLFLSRSLPPLNAPGAESPSRN